MPLSESDREAYREEVAAVAMADKRDVMLAAIAAYANEVAAQDALLSDETERSFSDKILAALHDIEGDFFSAWVWHAWERCGEMDARRKRGRLARGYDDADDEEEGDA